MWANAIAGITQDRRQRGTSRAHTPATPTRQQDKLIKINRWHAEHVPLSADGLAKQKEAMAAACSTGVLLWGNEFGAGNTHS
jgi:hypothetical protein